MSELPSLSSRLTLKLWIAQSVITELCEYFDVQKNGEFLSKNTVYFFRLFISILINIFRAISNLI